MSIQIPVYRPSLRGREKEYVLDCLESTWISSKGKYIKQFEEGFASYLHLKHAAGVCNGTVALHLALVALGIGPGDEVIVPTFTYVASVNAITFTGATPVFVDSLASTWQMDPEDVARKVTPKTRAIMVVHLYGHPCDMDALQRIARERKLLLVEDCAEAFGSKYHGAYAGTFGSVAAFSFFGNKTITTGEGGMVTTNDEAIYDRILRYRGQGLAKQREYWHDVIGDNYRMTNICAAIGLAQLERADALIARKREIVELYNAGLRGVPVTPQGEESGMVNSYWMYTVLVPNASVRDPFRDHLLRAGIETRPTFYPIHTMPMYAQNRRSHPVAEDLCLRGVNLPSFPDLTEQEVALVCSEIRKFFDQTSHR